MAALTYKQRKWIDAHPNLQRFGAWRILCGDFFNPTDHPDFDFGTYDPLYFQIATQIAEELGWKTYHTQMQTKIDGENFVSFCFIERKE